MIDSILSMSLGHFLWLFLQVAVGVALCMSAFGIWAAWLIECLFAGSGSRSPWELTLLRWALLVGSILFLRGFPFPALL